MTGTLAASALATIALPVVSSSGDITITFAPLVIASSACAICVASDPCALSAITCADGSSCCTALMKSGLSWVSNRAAHVEHGMRNAILPAAAPLLLLAALLLVALPAAAEVEADVVVPLLLHPATASAAAAAPVRIAACILFIEPPVS